MAAIAPMFFADPGKFREWLLKHHAETAELWVGFHKRDSGKPSITWQQSVDVALCFGWIDGVRKSLNAESYMIRFTPRKSRSKWSAVNLKRFEELQRWELVAEPGLAAFHKRDQKASGYSYEQREKAAFDTYRERKFRANRKALAFFESQAPWYRRVSTFWVMSAKKEETRGKRFKVLLDCCSRGEVLPGLARQRARDASRSRTTD